MGNKRKWEVEYENYKNGSMDKVYQSLKTKLEDKTISKEEYDQMKKIEKVKSNISKVTNILELRTKLETRLSKLKDEKKQIDEHEATRGKTEKTIKEKEVELDKLAKEKENVQKQLKNGNLSSKEKIELENKLSKLESDMEKNNKDFADNHTILRTLKDRESKMGNLAERKPALDKNIIAISSKISKCNMVASNLMKGASWDSIDLKLENWKDRKLTSKEKITDKIKGENKEKTERINESKGKDNIDLSEQIESTTEQILKEEGTKREGATEKENNEEKSLQEISEFEKKHPRLARIGKWIKSKWNKIRGNKNQQEPKKEEEKDKKAEPVEVTGKANSERDEFRQYLKDVAEKGMKQADREKLDAAKERAYAERAQKDAEWKNKQMQSKKVSAQPEKEDSEER